jgi:hypothetical protein
LRPACTGRSPLGDDSLHVAFADDAEEVRAVGVVGSACLRREQFPQQHLPLGQHQIAQISAIQPQQIEGVKAERPATAPQFVEHWPAVRPGTHDLAVEDGSAAGELLADGVRQRLECPESVPVARYEPVGTVFDARDGPEAVELRLENPVKMFEGDIAARQRHGRDAGQEAHSALYFSRTLEASPRPDFARFFLIQRESSASVVFKRELSSKVPTCTQVEQPAVRLKGS